MFEDCKNQVTISGQICNLLLFPVLNNTMLSLFLQWSMSRPLLGLILLNEKVCKFLGA